MRGYARNRMPKEAGDCQLGEAHFGGCRGKRMAQHVDSHAPQSGPVANAFQDFGKPNKVAVAVRRKERSSQTGHLPVERLSDSQPLSRSVGVAGRS